jgi:hypothetical protein
VFDTLINPSDTSPEPLQVVPNAFQSHAVIELLSRAHHLATVVANLVHICDRFTASHGDDFEARNFSGDLSKSELCAIGPDLVSFIGEVFDKYKTLKNENKEKEDQLQLYQELYRKAVQDLDTNHSMVRRRMLQTLGPKAIQEAKDKIAKRKTGGGVATQ